MIDSDQRVARAFHDVTPRGHAQRVLNFVRAWSNRIECSAAETPKGIDRAGNDGYSLL